MTVSHICIRTLHRDWNYAQFFIVDFFFWLFFNRTKQIYVNNARFVWNGLILHQKCAYVRIYHYNAENKEYHTTIFITSWISLWIIIFFFSKNEKRGTKMSHSAVARSICIFECKKVCVLRASMCLITRTLCWYYVSACLCIYNCTLTPTIESFDFEGYCQCCCVVDKKRSTHRSQFR